MKLFNYKFLAVGATRRYTVHVIARNHEAAKTVANKFMDNPACIATGPM